MVVSLLYINVWYQECAGTNSEQGVDWVAETQENTVYAKLRKYWYMKRKDHSPVIVISLEVIVQLKR